MEVLKKIWLDIRSNNGIKIILSLLHIKTPITEADSIRALACKALFGLSQDNLICQILGKLPIFHNEWALDSGQGEQEDIYWAKMLKSAHQDDIYQ